MRGLRCAGEFVLLCFSHLYGYQCRDNLTKLENSFVPCGIISTQVLYTLELRTLNHTDPLGWHLTVTSLVHLVYSVVLHVYGTGVYAMCAV